MGSRLGLLHVGIRDVESEGCRLRSWGVTVSRVFEHPPPRGELEAKWSDIDSSLEIEACSLELWCCYQGRFKVSGFKA